MRRRLGLGSLLLMGFLLAGCATAGSQQQPVPTNGHTAAGEPGHAHSTGHPQPYAGLQEREIKALAPEYMADLLAGKGAQYALAAELNHYPGPSHVLEFAAELGLTPKQEEQMRDLMGPHKERAKALGKQLVDLERELDRLFAAQQMTESDLDRLLSEIGQVESELRGEHLRTHLATTKLLTPEQITRYDELRGYSEKES